MVLLGKIMILQGVGHPISCLGVCYANDPKKGGYMTPTPALDLTTSLRGDLVQRIPFLHQELAPGKKFSKCYNYGGTAFFAQATPGGWGGYAIFFHARNFFPPPPWPHPVLTQARACMLAQNSAVPKVKGINGW